MDPIESESESESESNDESDSDSESESDYDLVFFAGIDGNVVDDGEDKVTNADSDNGESYDLMVGFSDMTYLHIWGIVALMLLMNGVCCCVWYQVKDERAVKMVEMDVRDVDI